MKNLFFINYEKKNLFTKANKNTEECLRILFYLIDLILLDNLDSLREAVFLCINPFETPL